MDRNTKVGFGVLAGAYALTVTVFSIRLKKVEDLLMVVNTTQDNVISYIDGKIQEEVDVIFEDIKDNYDE